MKHFSLKARRRLFFIYAAACVAASAVTAEPVLDRLKNLQKQTEGTPIPLLLAQAGSCSPRRTCGEHVSCEDAMWSLHNCSWGGRLDRDNDGIPCESLC